MSADLARARAGAAGVCAAAVLLAACGSDTTVITGEEYRALTAPLPTDAPGMRSDLARLEQDLASVTVEPGGRQTEVQAAACGRLSDLLGELEVGFGRYDLSKESARLLRVARLDCDEAPMTAADGIRQALALAPRATSEPSPAA